jgi:hypothetical protein
MKVQVSGEGGYIVSASRREFPGSKSHWPSELTLGVVRRDGSIDVWPAPYGTQTRGDKPPPGWHATAERLLNSPSARRAVLAGLKKYRKEMHAGTWGFLVKLTDGRKSTFSTVAQAMAWGEAKLKKMPNHSAYGLFHKDPKSPYHSVPFEAVVKNEYGVPHREGGQSWEEMVQKSKASKHERGDNPRTSSRGSKELLRTIRPYVKLYRDSKTGIAWVEDGSSGMGHSAHPNIHGTGSVTGMRTRGFWGAKDRTVRSHGFIYNIDRSQVSGELDRIARDACRCGGNHGEGARHEAGGNPRVSRALKTRMDKVLGKRR